MLCRTFEILILLSGLLPDPAHQKAILSAPFEFLIMIFNAVQDI